MLAISADRDSSAGRILTDFGVTRDRILATLKTVRGGARVNDPNAEGRYHTLERYSRDLTNLAREGKLDPVVGRDSEILTVVDKRGITSVTNTYDTNGRVQTQTYADGALWQFAYATITGGTTTTITDPRGYVRQDTFNTQGFLRFLTRCARDERFNPGTLLAEIQKPTP